MAGLAQICWESEPSPRNWTLGPKADDLAQAGGVHGTAWGGPVCRPLTAISPAESCSVAMSRHNAVSASGHRAAVLAAVHGVIKCSDLNHAVNDAAQGSDQRRLPDGPVRAIRDHDGVGLQQFLIGAQELGKVRRTSFLLAVDEDGDIERRLALPGLQRRRMHGDPGLIVRRAPPEQAPVAFGRLKRG